VQQYFALVQVSSTETPLDDGTKITYASSLFSQTAATWWYTLVQAAHVPTSWDAFMGKVRSEFIPQDHIRRSRDKLRKLRQRSSVASYVSEFRNIALTISGITDDEQFDRFCEGLKPKIKLKVLRSNAASFEEAVRGALNVDSAYDGMRLSTRSRHMKAVKVQHRWKLEIFNRQGSIHENSTTHQGIKGNQVVLNGRSVSSRNKDLAQGTCFVCHKKGMQRKVSRGQ
jgi:Retrotransposon gag protein